LSRKKENHWYCLISGIAVGALSLVRPYDAVILFFLTLIWAIGLDGRKVQITTILIFGLGAAFSGSLVLLYNQVVAGNAFTFPLESYYRNYFGPLVNALGFGPGRGMGWKIDAFPGHSPMEGILNSLLNFFSVNIELFGWSIGSLLLVTLFVVSGKFRRSDLLMLFIVFGIILFYGFYWFHGGPDFGARYWYLSIIPLVVLTVRGMDVLSAKLGNQRGSSILPEVRVILAVVILSFYSLVNYFPWRAIDKYYHYLNMRPDIRMLAEEFDFGKSLVLIRGERNPDYTSTWVYNPLNFAADAPIFAFDEDNLTTEELVKVYSDRDIWLVLGPSLTGRTYEVLAGPLKGNEVLEK